MWEQIGNELFERTTGPLSFRFLVQPMIAIVLAARSGFKDFREGQPSFLLTIFSDPRQRSFLFRRGWKDISRVFLLACALDLVYQTMVIKALRPGQTLIVAATLSIVPYSLFRGLANRIAGILLSASPGSRNSND